MENSGESPLIGVEFEDKTEAERNATIRREVAIQHKNKLETGKEEDIIAKTLLEQAEKEGTLLILFSRNSEGEKQVEVASEAETQKYTEWLASDEVIEKVTKSAQRIEKGRKQSSGIRELDKKKGHAKKSQENGGGYTSRFFEYSHLRTGDINTERLNTMQIIVDNIIKGILKGPGTIIVTPKNTEVIDSYGKGIKIARGSEHYQLDLEPFKYFVDSASYCPPRKR